MAGEWKDCSLGDVIELKRGYDLPQKERLPGNVPLVSSSGITDTHVKAMVKAPGVVTGRYGTLGQVFYVEQDFWPLNTTLYVRDFKGNDPRFISYFLRNVDFLAYSDKAAVPGLNRNHLHQARVRIPANPAEQRTIAHILGTLDDKIELLRRQNETLEQMARALFRAWFVDFEPVRAKMEGRWRRGASLPGLPVDGVCSGYRGGCSEECSLVWCGLVIGHVSSVEFVEYTNAGSTGTKMPRTSWAEMSRYPIPLPSQSVAQVFTERLQPLVKRIIAGIHESRTLAQLRDTLLPKLISGELRVKDAVAFLKERGL